MLNLSQYIDYCQDADGHNELLFFVVAEYPNKAGAVKTTLLAG